jgi:hypothetical protein
MVARFAMPYRPAPLDPPPVALDSDLRWLLTAAFASRIPESEIPASPGRVVELAEHWGLIQRLTALRSNAELVSALGSELAQSLNQRASRMTMRCLGVSRACHAVCLAAARSGTELVLLKGAALELSGLSKTGERYFTDVDLLVAPEAQTKLADDLLSSGFELERGKRHAHGVMVVRDQAGVGVELHTTIRDVQVTGAAAVGVDVLRQAALLCAPSVPVEQFGRGNIWVPAPSILVAHVMTQGWYLFHFVPHAPRHKTPLRVVADLCLLRVGEDARLESAAYEHVKTMIPESEFRGLVALSRHLSRGDLSSMPFHAQRVLDHIVASAVDESYRRSLTWQCQRHAIAMEGLFGWGTRQIRRTLDPSKRDIQSRITSGKARNALEARLQIAGKLAARAILGCIASARRSSHRGL